MRRPWTEVTNRPGSYHLLVGHIHPSFGGGPQGPYDSHRLRFAGDLMKRYCNRLSLEGGFSVEVSRADGGPIVHLAIESEEDLKRVTSLTSSRPAPAAPPWKARADFELTEALHERLLDIAGPPDQRGAGRKARERKISAEQDRSLRWNVNPRGKYS